MPTATQHTTMICLFHDSDQAYAAVEDLMKLGISRNSVGTIANSGTAAANSVAMEKWKVPSRDAQLLTAGMNNGGVVIAVSATDDIADEIEEIFTRHKASKVDEVKTNSLATSPLTAAVLPLPTKVGSKLNVVEEELSIGKRVIERGGVRIYSRVIERPVPETVHLREQHVAVERHPVDRPLTKADGAVFADCTLKVMQTGEEAVVSKKARIVEEVVIGKEETVRNKLVNETLRKTDVDVEQLSSSTVEKPSGIC